MAASDVEKENHMITSIANQRMKRLVWLQEKSRQRNKEGVFVAEGLKMFEEAPSEYLQEIYIKDSLYKQIYNEEKVKGNPIKEAPDAAEERDVARLSRIGQKLNACEKSGIFVETVADDIFKKVADTQTPQGILFVMKQLDYSLDGLIDRAVKRREEGGRLPLFLLLEDIQDPGNLGTMLRTAEGAGADAVIMSKGTVDIYNPKTIRSTMGSLYRVPFIYTEELATVVRKLQQSEITVYAAHLAGEKYFDEIDYEGGSGFLIGNEGNGLKKETADSADVYLKIPMEGKLESLNAGIAAALLMYRAAGYARHVKTKGLFGKE